LLISTHLSVCDTVRVFALLHGWRLLVASNLNAAVAFLGQRKLTVILYDQDVPGVQWSQGVGTLLQAKPSACLVLLSVAADEKLRLALLALGGYDVAPKPLTLEVLTSLVEGSVALLDEIGSAQGGVTREGRNPPWGVRESVISEKMESR
jgi:DNA-binding response OmpR family regulator